MDQFPEGPGGTAFWRETYRLKGGMEAIYDDMDQPMGLSAFAPVVPDRASEFPPATDSAPDSAPAAPVEETAL